MKKAISIILVLALMFSLCACGGSGKNYAAAEKLLADGDYSAAAEAFSALGDYKDSEVKAQEAYLNNAVSYEWISDGIKLTGDDIKDMFSQAAATIDEDSAAMYMGAIENCEFGSAEYSMRLKFNADGTFVYAPDDESFNAAMKLMFDDFMTGLISYFIDIITDMFSMYGMSVDELIEVYGASSEKEFVELVMGMSSEEMVDALIKEIGAAEFKEGCTFSGTYTVSDGKLQIMLNDASDIAHYDDANDTLVFDGEGVDPESLPFDGIYPMVFRHA